VQALTCRADRPREIIRDSRRVATRCPDVGRIAPQPVAPLARILLGALREAAVFLARAPDPAAARNQVGPP